MWWQTSISVYAEEEEGKMYNTDQLNNNLMFITIMQFKTNKFQIDYIIKLYAISSYISVTGIINRVQHINVTVKNVIRTIHKIVSKAINQNKGHLLWNCPIENTGCLIIEYRRLCLNWG